jgi:RNA polymerase-associated protein RTF1
MVHTLRAKDSTEGGWVRYFVGPDENNLPVYRICEVQSECQDYFKNVCTSFEPDLGINLTKPYKINDTTVNQTLELKHGKSLKAFNMDKVSNAPFAQVCFPCHWRRLDSLHRAPARI